jgi:hypothetical protein
VVLFGRTEILFADVDIIMGFGCGGTKFRGFWIGFILLVGMPFTSYTGTARSSTTLYVPAAFEGGSGVDFPAILDFGSDPGTSTFTVLTGSFVSAYS